MFIISVEKLLDNDELPGNWDESVLVMCGPGMGFEPRA